jgi:hypothetical protein
MLSSIIIDDVYMDEIMSIVGYPLLTFEDSDFELTKEQVITLVVTPSLREYYRWFPIKDIREYSVSGTFEIDFPDESTFGVTYANVNTVGQYTTSYKGNALINSRYWRKSSTYGPNLYNTGNDYNMINANILESALNQSMIDKGKAFRTFTDVQARKLKGYSTVTGKMSVIWANYDNDFSKIPFNFINDVVRLSQSKLLEQLLMIRAQANNSIPEDFNDSLFEDKSDELKTEVMERWKKFSKIAIQRG